MADRPRSSPCADMVARHGHGVSKADSEPRVQPPARTRRVEPVRAAAGVVVHAGLGVRVPGPLGWCSASRAEAVRRDSSGFALVRRPTVARFRFFPTAAELSISPQRQGIHHGSICTRCPMAYRARSAGPNTHCTRQSHLMANGSRFYRSNRLMKVAIAGGPPIDTPLCHTCTASAGRRTTRSCSPPDRGCSASPAAGGEAQTLTTLEEGEFRHVSPHVLPDGKTVLFTALSRSGTMEDAEICAVSISSRERRTLLKGAGDARYSPSGHLLYVRQADLLGVSFDPKRLQVTGTPFLAAASIKVKPQELAGSFDIAGDGTLAWIASSASDLQRSSCGLIGKARRSRCRSRCGRTVIRR